MKKQINCVAIIIFILLLTVLVTACGQNGNDNQQDTEVTFEEYQNKIFAFGVVRANDTYNVTIDFPANVDEILVKEGEIIEKGNVIAVLDVDDYNLQISKKQREINMERIELERLENNRNKVSNDLKHAQSLYDRALEDLKQNEILYSEGVITKTELDNYSKVVDENETAVKNLELSLGLTNSNNPEIQLQKQKIALIESDLVNMQNKLLKDYVINGKEIISNVEKGVIYELGYLPGDSIELGTKLFSIIDLDTIVVEADVSEEFIKEIKVGAKATIIPLADRSKTYEGTIINIAGRAIERKGETIIPVHITVENNDYFLLPGFNVDVEIEK
ncbi:MAG: hypothetical protein APF76_08590 [Desulfitibacter sp. BRH_c19]|nr:MAG: hypothetical protein APF76_08590 [Desulfitibacter sp. BRH_c19]